ncbi:MAG: hypothetical protein Fur0041_19180 [Bacteroidia bacterium]
MPKIYHMRTFLAFLIIVSFISCDQNTDHIGIDYHTGTFRKYLLNTFGENIPEEKHVFILLRTTVADEEYKSNMTMLNQLLEEKHTSEVTGIMSFNLQMPLELHPPVLLKTDWDNAIDRLQIPMDAITAIVTKNREIEDIIIVRPHRKKELQNALAE